MTDDAIPSRRISDAKLDRMLALNQEILENQRTHFSDYHGGLTPDQIREKILEHDTAQIRMADADKNIKRILHVIEGIPDYNARGEVIGFIGGMRNDLEDLKHQANGGGGFSVRRKDKIQIWAGAIAGSTVTAIGTVIAALIIRGG